MSDNTDPEPRLLIRSATILLGKAARQTAAIMAAREQEDAAWLAWYTRQPPNQLTARHHATYRYKMESAARIAAMTADSDLRSWLATARTGAQFTTRDLESPPPGFGKTAPADWPTWWRRIDFLTRYRFLHPSFRDLPAGWLPLLEQACFLGLPGLADLKSVRMRATPAGLDWRVSTDTRPTITAVLDHAMRASGGTCVSCGADQARRRDGRMVGGALCDACSQRSDEEVEAQMHPAPP